VVTQPGPAAADGSRRARLRVVLVIVLVLGVAGLAVAIPGIARQMLPRRFTVVQQRQIEAWEIARRWRALPESAIFPAAVTYRLPGFALNGTQGLALTARRLGVVQVARCPRGAGAAAARILDSYGCTAVLRATYADSTGSLVATVGVAVLPDAASAAAAVTRLGAIGPKDLPGSVRAAPISGTLASRFDDAQRQLSWNTYTGPYVILTTAGFSDGRPRVRVSADSYMSNEMGSLNQGLADSVGHVLGRAPARPTCPGAPGC
jgi:hypothetical protein